MPLPSGGAGTALAVTERALIRPLRGHLPQRGRLLCLTNALKAAIMNRLTGCGEAWYRAWFGSKRPRVRIPTLRPQKASAAAGAFFIPSTLRLRMRLHAYTLTRFTRVFLVPSQTKTTVSDKRRAAGRPANASRTLGGYLTSFGPLDQRRVAADNTSRTLVLPCASFGPRDHKLLRKLEFGAFLPPSLREVAERKRSRREFRSKEGHPLSHG